MWSRSLDSGGTTAAAESITRPAFAVPATRRAYGAGELKLDLIIHCVGVSLGVAGAIWLFATAPASIGVGGSLSLTAYAFGLLAMLGCSAAYNLGRTSRRSALLQCFDHSAIFIMIAGTYTPFTVNRLTGAWSIVMTSLVWVIAFAGMTIRLWHPRYFDRLEVWIYLALGWIGLIALRPLLAVLDPSTLVLLGVGAVLYTAGTVFHMWERLPFQNAIWHAFVLAAACCHYAAVLYGGIADPR